jgi:hypothetical protein
VTAHSAQTLWYIQSCVLIFVCEISCKEFRYIGGKQCERKSNCAVLNKLNGSLHPWLYLKPRFVSGLR